MECAAENFQALFGLVTFDLMSADAVAAAESVSEAGGGGGKQASAKKARVCEDGGREFFVRQRWVRKTRLSANSQSVVADKRKFKILVRRPSDEASVPRARLAPTKGKSKAIAKASAGGVVAAAAADSLDLDL